MMIIVCLVVSDGERFCYFSLLFFPFFFFFLLSMGEERLWQFAMLFIKEPQRFCMIL